MKKIYRIIAVLLVVLFAASCSEDFIYQDNVNRLSESSFYKTEQDFEDLIITTYMPMAFSQMFGVRAHVINFAADDRCVHEQFNTSQLQYDATSGDIGGIYWSLNTGVFRCNLFLQKCTEEIEMDQDRRDVMIGEARFMRGLYHLYLATWFEVPPLLTAPPTDPMQGIPNGDQDAIYDLVEEDFLAAIDLLPETWEDKQKGRATSGAAKAFLGKTYLVRAKFEEAMNTFGDLITTGPYALNMPQGTDSLDYVWSYLANFTPIDLPNGSKVYDSEFNSESIYEVNFSLAWDEGDRAAMYLPGRRSTGGHQTWFNGYSNLTAGYGNLAMEDQAFPEVFESPGPAGLEKDPRYYATFIRPGDSLDWRQTVLDYYDERVGSMLFRVSDINSTLGTSFGMRKHLYPFHNELTWSNAPFQDPNNWRLMRYADVLLMYAEAAFRFTNDPMHTEGLAALNEVRNRVGMPAVAVLSKAAIMHERDVELAAEHSRFWDLVRWYKDGWITISEVQDIKPTFQPRHVCYPIPLGEINRNYGVLRQNPKWE